MGFPLSAKVVSLGVTVINPVRPTTSMASSVRVSATASREGSPVRLRIGRMATDRMDDSGADALRRGPQKRRAAIATIAIAAAATNAARRETGADRRGLATGAGA